MRALVCVVLSLVHLCGVWGSVLGDNENGASSNEAINGTYRIGVDLGIINPKKYPLDAYERDETTVFRDLFAEYVSPDGSRPINYDEWIVMNNFGLLPDTQESLFERKINKRSTSDNKRRFLDTVRKGDILITGRGLSGLVGHSALMTTDDVVLEMPGGRGWEKGIPNNNRHMTKQDWYDEHESEWTIVYRCPDSDVANSAAEWAEQKYYNPSGGDKKTIQVTYRITPDAMSIDPNYCSKMVIQAYYFGVGSKKVIVGDLAIPKIIVPTIIPLLFLSPYKLKNMGRF